MCMQEANIDGVDTGLGICNVIGKPYIINLIYR